MEKNPQKELKIELTPEVAAGHYSNLAVISHNCKNLLFALRDNIANYEKTFGEISRKQPKGNPTPGGIPNPFEA